MFATGQDLSFGQVSNLPLLIKDALPLAQGNGYNHSIMNFEKTVLPNGLRVISSTISHNQSVCLTVFIGAGSRYEKSEKAGIAHFTEHLSFKGTAKRPSAREISEAIEGVGGVLNGGTDKELTVYWAKVATPYFPLAVDLLMDMLQNSLIAKEEVEKERRVITEEINMINDLPQMQVDQLMDQLLWPGGQALGRDVAGSKETVSALKSDDLRNFVKKQYIPNNAVFAIAGDITHSKALKLIEKAVTSWRKGEKPVFASSVNEQNEPALKLLERKTEQVHLCVGLKGPSLPHPDRYAFAILNAVLGEGMSSRLFLNIREKKGLVYDIHSSVDHYSDTGALVVYAGLEPERLEIALKAILEELSRLKEKISAKELKKVKQMTKGRLILRLEDSRAVAGWIGTQELLLDEVKQPEEVISRVDAITEEDLKRVAEKYLVTEKLNLAMVGPMKDGESFLDLLKKGI